MIRNHFFVIFSGVEINKQMKLPFHLKFKKIVSLVLIALMCFEQLFFSLTPLFAQEQELPQIIPQLSFPFEISKSYPTTLKFEEEIEDTTLLEKLLDNNIHKGVDFAMPENTEVLAVDDGEIIKSGEGDLGIMVKIKHSWGESVYGHLSSVIPNNNEEPQLESSISGEIQIETPKTISKGDVIGKSGSTGISTGAHLHLGIKNSLEQWIDPLIYLDKSNSILSLLSATESAELITASQSAEIKEPIIQPQVLGSATESAKQTSFENVSNNSKYLFNYKFDLNDNASVHFLDKATQRPSFAIADKDYNHKLRFFLKNASSSAIPTSSNVIEFPVNISDIPMNLRYTVAPDKVKEEFIIAENPFVNSETNIENDLKISFDYEATDLSITKENEEYVFNSPDGSVYWKILEPTLEDADGKKGTISAELNEAEKTFTLNVDKDFLKNATYPVTIDPTVILSGGFTESEAQSGDQRKIAHANGNWYAFYTDATTVFYKKSSDGSTWGSAVTLDSTSSPFAPTAWVEGTTIYVGWLRDTTDAIAVNTINTTSSDALGTQCTTGDLGSLGASEFTDFPSLAVADDGTVYMAVGSSATAVVEKLTFSGCTFTDITTGSGLTAINSQPIITTIGNNLHMAFRITGLAHAVYDGTSWTLSGGVITDNETKQGGPQRKIVYANGNWYAFYTDASTLFYKKSSNGTTWGSAVTLDSTSSPFAPTAWVEGTTIYVGWLRDTTDAIAVNTINTTSSDALGTQCTTGDLGSPAISDSDYPSLAVSDDGTVYIATGVGSSTTSIIEKLTFSGCTFTDITTGSGFTLFVNSVPTITTIGNNLHVIFSDGNGVSHAIYDGTSWTLSGGTLTESEAKQGGQQRKIVYANSNWYAFYTDSRTVFYKKSSDGATWGSAVTLDSTSSPFAPTAWVEGTTIYVGWLRDTGDAIAVNTISTASSDALGTQCTTGDLGTISAASDNAFSSLAVSDDGTVYITVGGQIAVVEKLTFSGCTFTNITSGSALTTLDVPTITTIGNNMHMVFQDGNISHSIYDGSSWTTSNTTIDSDTDSVYSLTTDGASLWLLTIDSTTASALYKFSSGSWSALTSPWTSETNLTSVSITYDSTNSDLYAFAIKDTSEQAYYKMTDATTISWGSDTSLGFTAGDLGHISSPEAGAGTGQIGITLRNDPDYMFSNLTPTRSTILDLLMITNDIASYSLTTDGINMWLLISNGGGDAAALYKCASCTSSSSWSTLTAPWTGQTNLTSVSITYDSTNSDLYAFAIKDTSEQAYYKMTDATTISWGSDTSLGFTAGDLGHISSPEAGAGTGQIGLALRNDIDYMFSNLTPTRSSIVDYTFITSTDIVSDKYSITTDGTSLWVLTKTDSASAGLYKCASCTSSSSWSTLTAPWTGQTNLTSVSITYDSTNSDLYAFAIKDTSEQAYYKMTDATTISWGSDTSLGFTAGDLGHISSEAVGVPVSATVRQGSNFEFINLIVGNRNPSDPSSLGGHVAGSFTTDTTPTLTFTLSDTDSSDTVKYKIQIDDSSDFSSAVVDYTSALAAQGSASFTVGQAAGSGSYTTGSSGQTLSDGNYYWRVKAIDDDAAESSYSTANSGAIAFKVDTTIPTTPGTPSTTTPTADTTPSWTWTASTDSGSGLATTPYTLQWSQSSSFSSGVSSTTSTTNSFTHSTALADGTWYFRVKATDAVDNESSYSSNGLILVDATAPSDPGTPSTSTSPTTDTTPSWTWTASTDSGSGLATTPYTLQWSQSSSFSSGVSSTTSTTNSFTHSTALADGTWYFRVKATDAVDNESDYSSNGSIVVDTTAPDSVDLQSPSNDSYTNNERPTFKWKAATGLSKYKFEINNGTGGDISIDNISPSRTSNIETEKYVIQYENFSDSDSDNNYISIYTKSSSSWSTGENDGKLREGKRTWQVVAYDSANNTKTGSRTLYADFTNPTLSNVKFENLGDKNGYLVVTDFAILGVTTDTLAPSKIEVEFYRENYFLGILTSTSLDKTFTHSLNNSNNNTSIDFSFLPIADYGKYNIKVYSVDKAGNKSNTFEFNKIQYLTEASARRLFAQDKEKLKELKEESQLSLLNLEKKAIVRREKEVEELTNLFKDVGNNLNSTIEVSQSQIKNVGTLIGSAIASLSSISTATANALNQISINMGFINQNASAVISDSEKKIIDQIAQNQTETGQAIERAFSNLNKGLASLKKPMDNALNLAYRINAGANSFYAIVFDDKPTSITKVTIEEIGSDYAIVSWQTNHYATGKVNYGKDLTYGKEIILDKREKHHVAKITGLKTGKRVFFEVMSNGKNYAYDAYYSFETKKK